jgi:DNA invertase Pin-like site-specific DNA recombinase
VFIGYARVSTSDQKLDSQLDALKNAGCQVIYSEKLSGKNTDRPELQRLLTQIRPSEIMTVTALDRLTRSAVDLLTLVKQLRERGAHIRSLREPWCDTATPMGEFLVTVLAGIAQLERGLILERADAGRKAAKARGVRFGPKPKLSPFRQLEALKMLAKGKTCRYVGEYFGVSHSTISRLDKKAGSVAQDDACAVQDHSMGGAV